MPIAGTDRFVLVTDHAIDRARERCERMKWWADKDVRDQIIKVIRRGVDWGGQKGSGGLVLSMSGPMNGLVAACADMGCRVVVKTILTQDQAMANMQAVMR
jgi:hypothetical protein